MFFQPTDHCFQWFSDAFGVTQPSPLNDFHPPDHWFQWFFDGFGVFQPLVQWSWTIGPMMRWFQCIVHLYFTELNLQICDYAQKRRIWRENCKYALDKNFHCHFCSRRKAAKFCHPERHAKKLSITSICNKTKSQPGTTICKKNCFKDNNLQFQNHYPEQQQHGRSFSGKIFFWGPLSR